MEVDPNMYVKALKDQRNGAADEAAVLRAALDQALARIKDLEAEAEKAKVE